MDSQTRCEMLSPHRRPRTWGGKVGSWAGMATCRIHRWGKGSPATGRDWQGHGAQGQWILGSDRRPQLPFPSRGSRLAGEQEGLVTLAGMNGWLLGTRPEPDEASAVQETASHWAAFRGWDLLFQLLLQWTDQTPLHMWPCRWTPALRFLEEAWGGDLFFQYVKHCMHQIKHVWFGGSAGMASLHVLECSFLHTNIKAIYIDTARLELGLRTSSLWVQTREEPSAAIRSEGCSGAGESGFKSPALPHTGWPQASPLASLGPSFPWWGWGHRWTVSLLWLVSSH